MPVSEVLDKDGSKVATFKSNNKQGNDSVTITRQDELLKLWKINVSKILKTLYPDCQLIRMFKILGGSEKEKRKLSRATEKKMNKQLTEGLINFAHIHNLTRDEVAVIHERYATQLANELIQSAGKNNYKISVITDVFNNMLSVIPVEI